MVVGKPDFELNSFGIQYKEKKVSYTNKKAGINILSNNQTENEHAAESKISNMVAEQAAEDPEKKITHSNQPTTRNSTAAEQTASKKFEKKDPQKPTSTTPSSLITPKDGVFDNVPQNKKDMVIQEGGSSHPKKEPAMPRTKLHGRAHQEAQAQLRESKQSPVLPKNAANDIITEMNIMKLDLMKDAKDGKGSNKPVSGSDDIEYGGNTFSNDRALTREEQYLETYGGDDEPTGTTMDKLGEVEDIKFKNPKQADKYLNAPNMTKKQPIKPKIASAASETIFKAISLKLDLAKTLSSNAGSTLVAAGTKKGKPNHINDKGERTQDGQHTVRGHGVGTPEQVTIDGVKTTQPRKVAVKPKGNAKTSLAGDMQMSKELENKTPQQLKESMDYITNSPEYQESIHRNATETVEEGTEKFDNNDKTNAIRARIAAREARKRKQGKKVNRAVSEINAMTNDMKELMKRDGEKIGVGEKDTRQMQDRFNEDHLSDFPEMKGTKQGKEVERHMNEHMQPIDNP